MYEFFTIVSIALSLLSVYAHARHEVMGWLEIVVPAFVVVYGALTLTHLYPSRSDLKTELYLLVWVWVFLFAEVSIQTWKGHINA